MSDPRPPFPPFSHESALEKVRLAEDGWNMRATGRDEIVAFLTRKWTRELDYRLILASIDDLPIAEPERKYHWPLGRRPDDHPGLSELGL